jgi:hypothetical protein
VTDPSYSGVLASQQVLTLLPGENPPYQISRDTTKDAWDEWVAQRESQSKSLESRRNPGVYSNNVTSLLYGMTDLDFYGTWSNLPGYGYGWVPRVGSGWIPYSSGRWCWYPGFGYTWISSEPWGWLPYHYGNWAFDQSMGWFWLPLPAYMGTWSPGRVNWHKGPGWIGWAPQVATQPHGPNPCPQGGNCGTAVSTDAFQSGRPLNPHHRMPVDLSQGTRVGQLDVPPSPLLVLPGLPVDWPAGAPDRQVHPPLGQFGAKPTGAKAVTGAAGAAVPTLPAEDPRAHRPHRSGIPAQRGPVTTPGIVLDPVRGQFVNAPNPVPGAGVNQMPATPGTTAGGAGQLPAQVSPGGLRGEGATKAGQLGAPRAPFQDEIGPTRSTPIGSALPAGANSRQGNQPSGAPGSGASPEGPTTGSWGVPRSPDRSASAPASPRSTSSPTGSPGGMSPRSSSGSGVQSSGSSRSGGSFPSSSGGSSGRGGGGMPSSPGGATGTYGGGHGGGSSSGGHPRR